MDIAWKKSYKISLQHGKPYKIFMQHAIFFNQIAIKNLDKTNQKFISRFFTLLHLSKVILAICVRTKNKLSTKL